MYDEAIRRLDADGETGAENWAAHALLGKMLRLGGSNRRHEVIAVCDDLVSRFETRKEPALGSLRSCGAELQRVDFDW